MDEPAIPPQAEFLAQLRRTQHAVRVRLDAELDPTGLTTPQYLLLAALERAPEVSASDLAREFGMSAQTVNVLVKGLESCGLVQRRAHPSHGRILQASLTREGRQVLRHGRELAIALQEEVLAGVPETDRAVLMRALKAVEQPRAGN